MEDFNDVYIGYELMDTDLHQIICSSQELTDDHCQVSLRRQSAQSVCLLFYVLSGLVIRSACFVLFGDTLILDAFV